MAVSSGWTLRSIGALLVLAGGGCGTHGGKGGPIAPVEGVTLAEGMDLVAAGALPMAVLDPPTASAPQSERPEWRPPGDVVMRGPVDLSPRLPPIGKQELNDCAAWASAYYLRSYLWASRSGVPATTLARQFSPTFVYNQINHGRDKGASISKALDLLAEKGVPSIQDAPYLKDHLAMPIPAQHDAARRHTITAFERVTSAEGIRAALYRGLPVIIHLITDKVFNGGKYRVFDRSLRAWRGDLAPTDLDAKAQGRHAMLVVGFDPGECKYKLVNSWGPAWRRGSDQAGYTWVHCDLFNAIKFDDGTTFLQEAFVITQWRDEEAPGPATTSGATTATTTPIATTDPARPTAPILRWGDMSNPRGAATTRRWRLELQPGDVRLSLRSQELDEAGCTRRPQRYECDFDATMDDSVIAVDVLRDGKPIPEWKDQPVTVELGEFERPLRLANVALLLKDASTIDAPASAAAQTAEPLQLFNWTVFVDGSPAQLAEIESVTYVLHHTFRRPRQKVRKNGDSGFPLSAVGWGEFEVVAIVDFKGGRRKRLKHCLDLGFSSSACK